MSVGTVGCLSYLPRWKQYAMRWKSIELTPGVLGHSLFCSHRILVNLQYNPYFARALSCDHPHESKLSLILPLSTKLVNSSFYGRKTAAKIISGLLKVVTTLSLFHLTITPMATQLWLVMISVNLHTIVIWKLDGTSFRFLWNLGCDDIGLWK